MIEVDRFIRKKNFLKLGELRQFKKMQNRPKRQASAWLVLADVLCNSVRTIRFNSMHNLPDLKVSVWGAFRT